VITAPRTVTVNTPITVGRIDFDSVHAYTITGSSRLTLNSTSGSSQIIVHRGSHTIGSPITLFDNTVFSVIPAASNLAITGTLTAGGVNLTKTGAGSLTVNNLRTNSLAIDGGAVVVAANGTTNATSVVNRLSIAGSEVLTGKLDLNNNAAIINYATGSSPVATIRRLILAGRGGSGLGKTWNGNGITSSAAAAAPIEPIETRSLGYAENAALPLGRYTNFRGQSVDATSVLIRFTRTGDANLDGRVNDDDVTIVGAYYDPRRVNAAWALGDFDYNGIVDDDDVTLLGAFYNPSAAPLAVSVDGGVALDAAAVPEPQSMVLVVTGFTVLAVGLWMSVSAQRRPARGA
jgi:hypothetical protein